MGVIIIAEAGVNHNGDINLAKKLVDVAAEAGVDYVKFQTFKTEALVNKHAAKADYQIENTKKEGSQYDMLKKLELSERNHELLIEYCKEKKVKFFSTAFDLESVDYLKSLNLHLWKIPSGEITNLPYIQKIGAYNEKTILSTGMCTLTEIDDAIKALVKAGTNKEKIIVLHCTTEYPAPVNEINLNAMLTIKKKFGVEVGYSDHTVGIEIPIAAAAMGAIVIEKHFTLDKTMDGPDHKASLNPEELKAMVKAIRNIEKAMGNGDKIPAESERKNIVIARKSIHLKSSLTAGTQIEEKHLIMKRPGDGISPMLYKALIGKIVKNDLEVDHKLTWEDLV